MNKYYITFGQTHTHSVNGKTFDKDCLAEIEAESMIEARKIAFDNFKGTFHRCFSESKLAEIIDYFPRGVFKI